jgi:CheY-like chemotaxis protein
MGSASGRGFRSDVVTATGSRVLVIDDDPVSSELVAYFLKSLGYMVAIAPDGDRALNMAFDDDIQLVILDVHMPRYDGPEVLAMLRRKHPRRAFKVVAVTGDDSAEARQAMDHLGADGFLLKPVDLDLLRQVVSRLVPQQHREGPLYRRVRERGVGRKLESRHVDPRADLVRSTESPAAEGASS